MNSPALAHNASSTVFVSSFCFLHVKVEFIRQKRSDVQVESFQITGCQMLASESFGELVKTKTAEIHLQFWILCISDVA